MVCAFIVRTTLLDYKVSHSSDSLNSNPYVLNGKKQPCFADYSYEFHRQIGGTLSGCSYGYSRCGLSQQNIIIKHYKAERSRFENQQVTLSSYTAFVYIFEKDAQTNLPESF